MLNVDLCNLDVDVVEATGAREEIRMVGRNEVFELDRSASRKADTEAMVRLLPGQEGVGNAGIEPSDGVLGGSCAVFKLLSSRSCALGSFCLCCRDVVGSSCRQDRGMFPATPEFNCRL